jgi:basic membrane protein A
MSTTFRSRTWAQWALSTGLALLTVGLMAGCTSTAPSDPSTGEKPAPSNEKTAETISVGIVFDSGGLGDQSFNDSAWRGIQKAESELKIKVAKVESKDEKDYETNLAAMADDGHDLVIAVGLNQGKALEKVAPQYPDTKFAIVDGSVTAPNVRMLKFKEEEGSFLVGYIAGKMTKTGKIGFVGGQELDLIKKFQYGFAAGIKEANPAAVLLPAKYTGNWDNVDDAKTAANSLFGSGADIVYHAAGRAGLGVIRAAKDKNLYAIGVDSDQDGIAPGNVLTSMIKNVDEAVFATIKDCLEAKFTAGEIIYGVKEKGVGISALTHTRETIGPEILAELEALKLKITGDELKVPASEAEFASFKN